METCEIMRSFYEAKEEEGRLATRHGMVEYLTTMRYIKRYLKPGMKIMEIGAGTGRYSCALAEQGYQVDAVELVEANINQMRQKMKPEMKLTVTHGNALDLSAFEDEAYDLTLLLGPMYHLFTEKDKLQALSEAIRVTRREGVIFAAYCMDCMPCSLGQWATIPGVLNYFIPAVKSLQSCPTLWDPIDGSPPGFPIAGILQARMRECVAISFSSA